MNEHRKVFGDIVGNPAAVSRGKQRARALEASGLEYLKGHGPGYTVKVSPNFTRIEVAGGESKAPEDYRFVVDQDTMSLYRLHVPSGSGGSFLTVARQNLAQYGRFLASHIARKELNAPAWANHPWKMGDGSFLNTEGAYADTASIITALKHVGGGWMVQGTVACRYADSTAFRAQSVYAQYPLTYSSSQLGWPAFGFYRPTTGAWAVYKAGKKADVWLHAAETSEERREAGNGLFGLRAIVQRIGQSPFFNSVAACGKLEGKGFVFASAEWGTSTPAALAGTQPRLAPDAQHGLSIRIGSTKPFDTQIRALTAPTYGYTNLDCCPLFAGPKGTMSLLAGASVQPVSIVSAQRELVRTNSWPDGEGGTVLEETFRYAWELNAAAGGAMHWIKTADFGETWETVPEPQTAGCFSVKVKLSEHAIYTHNAAEETPAPSAQT